LKVAIYARYSSDNQRDASIADQLRVCREFAARQGGTVVDEFTDHAISGATLLRSGFQALMRDALNRRFDVVLAESLDRFSRGQEDTAGLFKRLTFAGVNIVTLADGDITHLHVGLKGTMNALFLKDLADLNEARLARPRRARKVGRWVFVTEVLEQIAAHQLLAERDENPLFLWTRAESAANGTSHRALERPQ
jgi:DNA invertase Pin-like site-specific DNA recombinase